MMTVLARIETIWVQPGYPYGEAAETLPSQNYGSEPFARSLMSSARGCNRLEPLLVSRNLANVLTTTREAGTYRVAIVYQVFSLFDSF